MTAFPCVRPFPRALCWSLLAHGVLLLSVAGLLEASRNHARSAPLLARLASSGASPQSSPSVRPQVQSVAESRQVLPTSQPRQALPPAPLLVETNDVPTQVLPTVQRGLDAGGVRAYRVALAVGMRRSGVFVRGLSSEMRGQLALAVTVSPHGQVLAVDVQRSSGVPELDRLAISALQDVVPRTPLPAVLQGQAISLVLPLEVD